MRILAVFALCLFSVDTTCYAQRLSSGGTAAQFRDLAEMKANWLNSKKLAAIDVAIPTEMPSQVDNPDNMSDKQVGDLAFWQFHVTSVVDEKNMILRVGQSNYWLTDHPTKGLADGDLVRLVGPVMRVGTKQYTTVLGATSTIKAFRFVTQQEIKKQEQERAAEEEAKFWGTWHSKAGTSIEARFISWKAGKVELQRKDGRRIVVDVGAFTEEDAEKLKELNRLLRTKKK